MTVPVSVEKSETLMGAGYKIPNHLGALPGGRRSLMLITHSLFTIHSPWLREWVC